MAPFITFILSILISLTIPSATAQESEKLDKICRKESQNYTNDSPYVTDLKNLLDGIYANAPVHHGFYMAQTCEAHGIGLCRGDVSADFCDFCLYDARCKITQRCNKKAAIVWYDYCSLKYSDNNFFGKIDTENELGLYNVDNATDAKGFNRTARSLLGELSKNATRGSKQLFAFGTTFEEYENATIYGMVQCSMDLSKKTCARCLAYAVNNLPGFTTESSPVGGRTITGSCNVRYQIYAFLNNLPPTGNNNNVVVKQLKYITN